MSEETKGRPALFRTPEELEVKVAEYFESLKETKRPPTITGLVLYLGFESRQSFYDYQAKEDFSYAIKKARTRIENEYEVNLSGRNPTGSIFALKNMGWADKTEVDHTTKGESIQTIDYSKLSDSVLEEIARIQKPASAGDNSAGSAD